MTSERASAPEQWVRGRFLTQWEVSSFQPTGTSKRWWVSFLKPKDKAIKRLIDRAGPPGVEIEFFGTPSDPGMYGHMGLYERELVVRRIREPASPKKAKAETERESA